MTASTATYIAFSFASTARQAIRSDCPALSSELATHPAILSEALRLPLGSFARPFSELEFTSTQFGIALLVGTGS